MLSWSGAYNFGVMLALGVTGVLQSVFMSLGDDLLAPFGRKGQTCSFGLFVETSEYAEQFEVAMQRIRDQREIRGSNAKDGYTIPWLLDILNSNGIYDYSRGQIKAHLARACSCYRHLALAADESR